MKSPMFPDRRWIDARAAMMLDPAVINLNTGSFGPLPRGVFERVTKWRRQLAAEPTDFFVRWVGEPLWEARSRLAKFLGGDPQRLLFTTNVSVSINLVAAGLTLASPGEVLLTDHEYGAMHWCWERHAARQGLTLRTFPLPVMAGDPGEIVESFVRAFTPRTRLLFFSHVLSPTGLVLPARDIVAEARKRGIITVIDGAHAPAMIPLDLEAIDADFYGGNGHKWLLAPTGVGFLNLNQRSIDRLLPLQVSWGYHHDRSRPDERDEFGATPRLRALEFDGTRDVCPWLVVPDAIDFQAGLGWDEVRGRIAELAAYTRDRLDGRFGLTLHTPPAKGMHGSLTAFRIAPTPLPWFEIRRRLWERGIEVPIIERPDGLLIRVSTHFYNTKDEIDRLAEELPAALK